MAKYLSTQDVWKQSKAVFGQFAESKWIPNAKINKGFLFKDAAELVSCGIGKFLVCVGMGASLEKVVEPLKQYRDRVDVVVCDKGFGPLLDHGVKADYVFCCDASIPFDYLKPWKDQTEGVKLLATPYANPEWTRAWKGPRYHFVMRDAIESENIFTPIMGKLRGICAGSNVSNAIVTFFLGCDEYNNQNWSGYERLMLVGFDYSWQPDGNYYAWIDPKPKRNYMNHRTMIDDWGNICFSSENLYFSVKWLASYLATYSEMPVWNCSERGLLGIRNRVALKDVLARINPDRKASAKVRQAFEVVKTANRAFVESAKLFKMTREDNLWL